MNGLTPARMATGIKPQGGRIGDDYGTPPDVTQALLVAYRAIPEPIWEPAVGEGLLADELRRMGYDVIATGLPGMDFLQDRTVHGRAIVTNPPFSLAVEFIEKIERWWIKREVRFVALLLKSQFWHAKRRHDLFIRFTPAAIHPLLWRPDFTGAGAPVMDVSWNVWDTQFGNAPHTYPFYRPLPRPKQEP